MAEKSVEEAVRLFVGDFANSEQPLRQLPNFLLKLQSEGWTQSDLREVQARVLKHLAFHGRDAPDQSA